MANCGNLSTIDLSGCYKDNSGGIEQVYICFDEQITGTTTTSTGNTLLVTSIPASAIFHVWKPSRWTSNFTETTPDNENVAIFEQTCTCVFPKRTGELAYQMKVSAQGLVKIIVKDNNGRYWFLGEEFGLSVAPSSDSGTAMADGFKYTVVFKGTERSPAPEVSASIIAGLTTT